jgi:hypothetical protein
MINNKCGAVCGMRIDGGKPKHTEKTSPNATLSTTNPTRLDPGSKLGRQSGKPVTNRLSQGTTCSVDSISEICGSVLLILLVVGN